MMEILQVSADANRIQHYETAPLRTAKPAALHVKGSVAAIYDLRTITEKALSVPENKVPKAEEIKKMIQSNGYPYKSDVYKAVARIVEQDLN